VTTPCGLVIKLPDQFAVFATFGRPKVDAVGIPRLARGEKDFVLDKTLICKLDSGHLIRHGVAVPPSPQGEGLIRTSNARPYAQSM